MDARGWAFLVVMALALAVVVPDTYVTRVAVFVLLVSPAALVVSCHALHQTVGVAQLWRRAMTSPLDLPSLL